MCHFRDQQNFTLELTGHYIHWKITGGSGAGPRMRGITGGADGAGSGAGGVGGGICPSTMITTWIICRIGGK